MSFLFYINFPPIKQPDGWCCIGAGKLSDEDELIYNRQIARFETLSKNRWFDCFCCSDPPHTKSLRKAAWKYLETAVQAVVGKRLVKVAFTEAGLTSLKNQNKPLTALAYNRIMAKSIRLENLEKSAYKVWKAGKFYRAFLMKPKPSKPKKIKIGQEKSKNVTITETGLHFLDNEHSFNHNEVVASILGLSSKPPVKNDDATAIVRIIYRDLTIHNITRISLDNLIMRIATHIKKKGYELQKPEHWETVKPLARLPFEKLTLLELNELAKLAKETSRKDAQRERKEKTYEQKSSTNLKEDVLQTHPFSNALEKSPLSVGKEKDPSKENLSFATSKPFFSPINQSFDSSDSSDSSE